MNYTSIMSNVKLLTEKIGKKLEAQLTMPPHVFLDFLPQENSDALVFILIINIDKVFAGGKMIEQLG